jgi:hypothetical protein
MSSIKVSCASLLALLLLGCSGPSCSDESVQQTAANIVERGLDLGKVNLPFTAVVTEEKHEGTLVCSATATIDYAALGALVEKDPHANPLLKSLAQIRYAKRRVVYSVQETDDGKNIWIKLISSQRID